MGQVRSGAVPGRADHTDDLPNRNGLPFNDRGPGEHMTVAGVDLASVPDVDVPAFSAPVQSELRAARADLSYVALVARFRRRRSSDSGLSRDSTFPAAEPKVETARGTCQGELISLGDLGLVSGRDWFSRWCLQRCSRR
jgi:hypothetical protein